MMFWKRQNYKNRKQIAEDQCGRIEFQGAGVNRGVMELFWDLDCGDD